MWVDIIGYENLYEINEIAQIRRINNLYEDARKNRAHIIRPGRAQNGKFYVILWKNGIRQTFMLHNLYANAFHVSQNEAIRRIYGGFTGKKEALQNVRGILLENQKNLAGEAEKGVDRHDELLYIQEFIQLLDHDEVTADRNFRK